MRSRILAALMLLMLAAPAGAELTDDEPNDTVADAALNTHITKTGTVTIDAGVLELVMGDIDFLGITGLSMDDVVTVTTTPLDDPPDFEKPDTMVGLFESTTTDPTTMILCRGDNVANDSEQNCPQGNCVGKGSICRFLISAPGDYYVGVTGYRGQVPQGCMPGVNCTSFPFDGIASSCSELGGEKLTCGFYQVTIAVNSLPEPGVMLQLVSGGIGLAWLNGRRNRRLARSSRRAR